MMLLYYLTAELDGKSQHLYYCGLDERIHSMTKKRLRDRGTLLGSRRH